MELAREQGRALDLTLLEGADRLGGSIRTERRDGFIVECGADSFISEKPWALALCGRLGLEPRLLRTDDRFRSAFVVHRGRLHALPEGFQLMAPTRLAPLLASPLFSWRGKARMALDLVLPRGGDPDESLGAFVRRRLGREALERVAQPLIGGIYTADPDSLSLAATMPRFLEMERRDRSVILGMRRAGRAAPAAAHGVSGARWSLFVTLADGMEGLVHALAERLAPGAVRLKERVAVMERRGEAWRLATAEGGAVEADAVVLATESHQSARLLRPLDPGLAHLLEGIPYASSATVTAGLSPSRHRPPAEWVRVRGSALGGPAHHRLHVLEREVPGPRARRHRPPARVPRRGPERGGARGRRRRPGRDGARPARRARSAPAGSPSSRG